MRNYFIYLYTLAVVVALLLAATAASADSSNQSSDDSHLMTVPIVDADGQPKSMATLSLPLVERLDRSQKASAPSAEDGVDCSQDEHRGLDYRPQLRSNARAVTPVSSWRTLELFVVASPDFLSGKNELSAVSEIVQTIEVANRYLRDLKISISLVGVQLASGPVESGPYAEATQLGDGLKMLQAVKNEWQSKPFPRRDATVVFASSRFRDTFGLAYTGASCIAPNSSYLFVTKGGIELAVGFGATLAHELGHLLGMSHDGNPVGAPSLMWPTHIEHANGFSAASLAQYFEHTGEGMPGGACLSPATVPGDDVPALGVGEFRFVDGASRSFVLSEGEHLEVPLQVVNHAALPGVRYRAENLPVGASVDPFTGVLSFEPTYNLATLTQPFVTHAKITAEMLGASAVLALQLDVTNRHRAPVITSSVGESVELFPGSELSTLQFVATAPDAETTIRKFSVLNSQTLKRAGFKFARHGSNVIVADASGARQGNYTLMLQAADRVGAKGALSVAIDVKAASAPVIATAMLSDGAFGLTFASPTEAAFADLTGLPVGSQAWFDSSGAKIFAPQTLAPGSLQVASGTLLRPAWANDGAIIATTPPRWPGASQSASAAETEPLIYDALTGDWFSLGCDNTRNWIKQFGGLPDDLPVAWSKESQAAPAIVRRIGGGLLWVPSNDSPFYFGLSGDAPLAVDSNGDGHSEAAVYRPSERRWYLQTAPGVVAQRELSLRGSAFGLVLPFVGDLDGDGKQELIAYERSASGSARFRGLFADGREMMVIVATVAAGKRAVPFVNDVDNDGRSDVGVILDGGTAAVFLSTASSVTLLTVGDAVHVAFQQCGSSSRVFARTPNSLTVRQSLSGGLEAQVLAWPEMVFPQEALRRRAGTLERSVVGDFDGDRQADLSVRRSFGARSEIFIRYSAGGSAVLPTVNDPAAILMSARSAAVRASRALVFSGGTWYLASNNSPLVSWGEEGDHPVTGDFDGDGQDDLAVFRPRDGSWWIHYGLSDGGTLELRYWGALGDVPVAADYDGDGITDLAIFRPSEGSWYVRSSSGAVIVQDGAELGSTPVVGDFTGSDRAEFVAWSVDSGLWSAINDRLIYSRQLGLPGDVPLGLALSESPVSQPTVYRQATGEWFSLPSLWKSNSNESVGLTQWGLPRDLPASVSGVTLY